MSRRVALPLTAAAVTALAVGLAVPATAAPAPSAPVAAAVPAVVIVGNPSYAAQPSTMWVSSTIITPNTPVTVSVSGPWSAAQLAENSLQRPTTVKGSISLRDAIGFADGALISVGQTGGVITSIPPSAIRRGDSYETNSRTIPAGPTANWVSWTVGANGLADGSVNIDGFLYVDSLTPTLVGTQAVSYWF